MTFTAADFIAALHASQSDAELAKITRYFKFETGGFAHGDQFIGVRMGMVFDLAKQFVAMELDQIEILLESEIHEARAGAISIMAKQFALKTATVEQRGELAALYLRRHDRINNWDLVDLGAHQVLGAWLLGQKREVLYQLAQSDNLWERRSAMFATLAFTRKGQLDDCFALAEILVDDPQDLINKVVGGMLREAGKTDRARLLAFLGAHAPTMPRVALRYAIEHLEPGLRADYLGRR